MQLIRKATEKKVVKPKVDEKEKEKPVVKKDTKAFQCPSMHWNSVHRMATSIALAYCRGHGYLMPSDIGTLLLFNL